MKTIQIQTISKGPKQIGPPKPSDGSDGLGEKDWPASHPTDEELEDFFFGRLTEQRRGKVFAHLCDCVDCREYLKIHTQFIEALRMVVNGHSSCATFKSPKSTKILSLPLALY